MSGLFLNKPSGNLEIVVCEEACRDGFYFFFKVRDRETGKKYVASIEKVKWIEYGEGQQYPTQTFILSKGESLNLQQELARGLGRAGIVSETEAHIRGELEATKYHLEDLRKMVGVPCTKRIVPQ